MEDVLTNTFTWPVLPVPALIGATGTGILAILIVIISRYFDATNGLLTLSIMVVMAFITATFAAMLYNVPTNPLTEILIGALATSVGAIIAFWCSRGINGHKDQ